MAYLVYKKDDINLYLTGIDPPSTNAKTGPMVQSWILKDDGSGYCPPSCGFLNNGCYVMPWRGPSQISQHNTIMAIKEAGVKLRNRALRIGSYGDPGYIPIPVWLYLLKRTVMHTAYTHMWREQPDLRGLAMASVDTQQDFFDAMAAGWGTFMVLPPNVEPLNIQRECPYPLLQCINCGLCDGSSRRHIFIRPHGWQTKKASEVYNAKLDIVL